MAQETEIRYLNAPSIDTKKKKYCRFKKSGIKYIDYKDPEFLKKHWNISQVPASRGSGREACPPDCAAALCN